MAHTLKVAATAAASEGTYALDVATAKGVQPETRQQNARMTITLFMNISESGTVCGFLVGAIDGQRPGRSMGDWPSRSLKPACNAPETSVKSRRALGYSRLARITAPQART